MGLTDISWPGLFIGVPAPNLFYWGSRPKPRRCAKLSRKPTLLSLRGRLMAGEWQGSSDGKVTGRGGLSILEFHPKPRRCAKPSRKPTRLSLRGRLMPFLLGFHPKPRRFAKPSRKPTRLSLRGRLMAGEWQGSSDGKVTGRGGPLMRTSRCQGSSAAMRKPTLLSLRDRLMPFYWGSTPNTGAPQALSDFAAQSHGPGRSADADF